MLFRSVFGKELKLKDRVVLGDGIIYLSKDFEKLGGGLLFFSGFPGVLDVSSSAPSSSLMRSLAFNSRAREKNI